MEQQISPILHHRDTADPNQSNRLFAVFTGAGNGLDVLVARSDDSGHSWSSAIPASDVTTGDQFHPAAEVDAKGNLVVGYLDTRLGSEDVFVGTVK